MGGLEAEVLAASWAADRAMVPAEVRGAMGDNLAYTTIPTILTRLWEKGLVHRTLRGRAYEYSPAVSEAELAARRMQAALDNAGDHQAALSRFVGALNKRDERALRKIIADLEKGP